MPATTPTTIHPLEPRRLLAVLAADVTYGGDGSLPLLLDTLPFVAVRGGRTVLSGGFRDGFGHDETAVYRFNADGTTDRRFKVIREPTFYPSFDVVGADEVARPLLNVGGDASATLIRYRDGGGRDKSFNATLTPPAASAAPYRVNVLRAEPQADGSLLALVGATTAEKKAKDRRTALYLARLNAADGTPDAAFAGGGYLPLGETFDQAFVRFAADAAGRVYLSPGPTGGVYRFRANGSRDKTFGDNGRIATTAIDDFALDAAGRCVVWHSGEAGTSIRRYDARGRSDAAFARNTDAAVDEGTAAPLAVLPQPDGTFYVQATATVRRLNADGTVDPTYLGGRGELPGSGGQVIAVLPGGRVLARFDADVRAYAPARSVAQGASGTLYVNGTDAADDLTVGLNFDDPSSTTVRVTFNGQPSRYRRVTRIEAELKGGDNRFASTLPVTMIVRAGDGRNRITTGSAGDNVDTGDGDDTIATGGGSDQVGPGGGTNRVDLGPGEYGRVDVYQGQTPAGRNTVRGTGGQYSVVIEHDGPADIDLTGTEAYVRLGDGDHVVKLNMSGEADVETGAGDDLINTAAGRGNDFITPGPGDDRVYTGRGNDRVFAAPVVPPGTSDDDLIDLGDGFDTASGGVGDDTLVGGRGDDSLEGETGNDRLLGGDGNDMLLATYIGARRPSARNVLDGGPGTDRYWREGRDDELAAVEEEIV